MIDFAYSKLNLRFNPFGELDRQQKIDCAVPRVDISRLANFIASANQERRAVQFLGSRGSGKTTHLWLLNSMFRNFHYLHIPEGATRSIPQRTHLMIDEAQRMTWSQRRNGFKKSHRVILGTHRCYATRLRRQGFQTITVNLDRAPEEAWVTRVLERKINYATRISGGAGLRITPNRITILREQFGHNIRQMERHLYELVQNQVTREPITDTESFAP